MELLHRRLQRHVGEHRGTVAAAFDEMLPRHHRVAHQVFDGEFERALDHAVDDHAVLCRVDVGNARMQDGEVERVRRDGAVEHLQRRAGVLGARLALRIGQDAHHVLFEARRRLQHRRDDAGHVGPGRVGQGRRVGQRLSGSAGRGGAGCHRAGERDAAAQQGAAMQQSIAGNLFQRRAAAVQAFPHRFTPGFAASIDAVAVFEKLERVGLLPRACCVIRGGL
jgi:hypothetical protein